MVLITIFEDPVRSLLAPATLLFLQIAVVVSLSKLLASVFKHISQPPVAAEIVAGILLGPTVWKTIESYASFLGADNTAGEFLEIFGNFGLVLFMFLVGIDVDPQHLLFNLRKGVLIAMTSVLIPFAMGCLSGYIIYAMEGVPVTIDPEGNVGSPSLGDFISFCGISGGITAFPVLMRVLSFWNLTKTDMGLITICASAFTDVILWIGFAIVLSFINATNPLTALWALLSFVAFCLAAFFIARPILLAIVRRIRGDGVPVEVLSILMVGLFISAAITEMIGVHSILGSLCGAWWCRE